MLRLTTKIDYGLRALIKLAEAYPNKILSAQAISSAENIPLQFLEQIMVILRRTGIVVSVKGPGGGFTLGKPPEEISIKEVFSVLENPYSIIKCLDPFQEELCERENSCTAKLLFERLQNSMEEILKNISLKDLVEMGKKAGLLS